MINQTQTLTPPMINNQAIPNAPDNQKKYAILFVVFITISVLAMGSYIYYDSTKIKTSKFSNKVSTKITQTTEQDLTRDTGLKTYTSRDKTFSLQYPSTYTILLPDKKSPIADSVTFLSTEVETLQTKYSFSIISYKLSEKGGSLKDIAYKKTLCEKPNATEKEYSIGDKKGLLLEDFTCESSQNMTFIFFQNKDILFQIVVRSEKNLKFASLQPHVESILQSFQFRE